MVVYNKTFFEIKIMLIVEEIPISLSCSLLVICNTNTQRERGAAHKEGTQSQK